MKKFECYSLPRPSLYILTFTVVENQLKVSLFNIKDVYFQDTVIWIFKPKVFFKCSLDHRKCSISDFASNPEKTRKSSLYISKDCQFENCFSCQALDIFNFQWGGKRKLTSLRNCCSLQCFLWVKRVKHELRVRFLVDVKSSKVMNVMSELRQQRVERA